MDYKTINEYIIKGLDVPNTIIKNKSFYNYLLNNRVAYYYCSNLSKNSNDIEKKIIEAGNKRNKIFYNTLEELDKVCKKNNIDYLLYKTYKYFGEVIGGDIDIIIKKEDFKKILDIFSKEGWRTEEDEPGKGKCEKNGYITIEPHITISWNGNNIILKEKLWENINKVKINGKIYKDVGLENEILSIYMKIMYGPEYLDLYDYLLLNNNKSIFNKLKKYFNTHELKLISKINNFGIHNKFPSFLSSIDIFYINILNFIKKGYFNKMMFIHNIYWRNRYNINGKLPYLTKYIKL